MAQAFTEDWYEPAYNANNSFTQAEQNDNTLKSNFSGSSNPLNPEPGQQWYDLDTGTMKFYNVDWQNCLLQGRASFKLWLYTNDIQPGMKIDNSVTDKVLALRGGSSYYNSPGGSNNGTWNNASGITVGLSGSHNHKWKDFVGYDNTYDSLGNFIPLNGSWVKRDGIIIHVTQADGYCQNRDYYTDIESDHNHSLTSNNLWRPTAAIGTLQYPNLD